MDIEIIEKEEEVREYKVKEDEETILLSDLERGQLFFFYRNDNCYAHSSVLIKSSASIGYNSLTVYLESGESFVFSNNDRVIPIKVKLKIDLNTLSLP